MKVFVMILGLAYVLPGCGSPAERDAPRPVELAQPDRVITEGRWELRIWYRQRGSRSEGQHGVLLRDGVPVEAARSGEVRDTSLGKMRYYAPTDGDMPWAKTGWNFADPDGIPPSWEVEEGEPRPAH